MPCLYPCRHFRPERPLILRREPQFLYNQKNHSHYAHGIIPDQLRRDERLRDCQCEQRPHKGQQHRQQRQLFTQKMVSFHSFAPSNDLWGSLYPPVHFIQYFGMQQVLWRRRAVQQCITIWGTIVVLLWQRIYTLFHTSEPYNGLFETGDQFPA